MKCPVRGSSQDSVWYDIFQAVLDMAAWAGRCLRAVGAAFRFNSGEIVIFALPVTAA
jgi:hypothetical protein